MKFKISEDFKNFFLGLLQTKGIGKKHLSLILNLYTKYGDELLKKIDIEKFRPDFTSEKSLKLIRSWFNMKNHFCKQGEKFLKNLQKKRVNFLLKFELPEHLQNVDWLFAEGNLDLLFTRNNIFIGMVGTRSPKGDYKNIIHTVIVAFKKHNPVVVSGLAKGIDSAVHRTAVELKIPTISVLGYGILHNYSTSDEYQFLRKTIPESGGLIISAYKPSELPRKKNFLERNELIVQLSDFVIPVQGTVPSGTFSTVAKAVNKNKPVICIKNGWVNEICNYLQQLNYFRFFVYDAKQFDEKTVKEILTRLKSEKKGKPRNAVNLEIFKAS